MTGTLEKELIKATKFKPPKGGFDDRQDELAALAKAAAKLADDDFDDLSTEAADWVNDAVKAVNVKEVIEEFPDDAGSTGEIDAEAARNAEADEDDAEQGSQAGTEGSNNDAEADAAAEMEAEAANEANEAKTTRRFKAPKGKIPGKKPVTRLVGEKQLQNVKTRYDDVTGEKDRFGVIIGTKTHDAIKLYEKGTTSQEITEKVGGRHYNILRKLTEAGHLVERTADGIFTLTHKDDIGAKQQREKAEKAKIKKK